MPQKLIDYLLTKHDYIDQSVVKKFCEQIGVTANQTDFDEDAIDCQFEIMMGSTLSQQSDMVGSCQVIFDIMKGQFKDFNNYQHLLYNLKTSLESKLKDPKNKLNDMIPIKIENLENNQEIVEILAQFGSLFQLDITCSPKGVLLKFNAKHTQEYMQEIIKALNAVKLDTAIPLIRPKTIVPVKKVGPKNNADSDRVKAFVEAKQMRAFMPQQAPPVFIDNGFDYPIEDAYQYQQYPAHQYQPMQYQSQPHMPQQYIPQQQPYQQVQQQGQPTNSQIKNRFDYQAEDAGMKFQDPKKAKNQIQEYRDKMRNKNLDQRRFDPGNQMTMGQLDSKIEKEAELEFGKASQKLTNEFRARNNLPALQWSDELYWLARTHSYNMSIQVVPFGHAGFNQRAGACPFSKQSFAENVAYCNNYERNEIPKIIVDGWIESPGHRKNMLSRQNCCGIAAFKGANGNWYFTQLFAFRNF